MTPKSTLWFDSRKDFYDWIVKSQLAITKEELENSETKRFLILAPLNIIDNYLDLTNYFQCDTVKTLVWVENPDDQSSVQVMPIVINSTQLTQEEAAEESPAE